MTGTEIRAMQREHIVGFLSDQDFTGRVLDFGCGTQPYRAIVEANGGEYTGYNRAIFPGGAKADIGPDDPLSQHWDVILNTQVLEYMPDPKGLLWEFRLAASKLVITIPTNWPEVEVEDLVRFTRAGMERLLNDIGLTIREQRQLGRVPFGDREWMALGYGFVAE